MDRNYWKMYQDFLHITHEWSKIVNSKNVDYAEVSDMRITEYKRMKAQVKSFRDNIKPRLNTQTTIVKERLRIRNLASSDFSVGRSRSRFGITVGRKTGNRSGQKIGRGQFSITVGFMWYRRVQQPLYSKGFSSGDWLIIDATEMKVNSKHVRLFECHCYSPRLDENKRCYVGEKKQGKTEFFLGHTINTVISGVEDLISAEVHKTMIGESDDNSNG